ncbi:MAG: Rpn family recombination-promoting nuclease/putative transposase, partial [Lachnospiraceae bacterium]|nr:Rpn family recombination-promoting nuclease/putative transposase [Lachnospiraceae bacterium]
MERKRFCNLNLTNAFMFGAAMSDPRVMRIVLEVLLGRTVKSVTVNTEQTLLFSSDSRNIRLDVFAENEDGTYNVEMQGEDEGNLPKRSRYHQAEMDVMTLRPGEDFNNLKPNIVIFICKFDPFEDNLYQYTFENICHETGKVLGDETWKIFFNIKGKNVGNTPERIINLLTYMANTTDECAESLMDDNVKQIHKYVSELKRSREWEGRYMRFDELLKKEKKEGYA